MNNHEETRKRVFRRIRDAHLGTFFDLNESPHDLDVSAYASGNDGSSLMKPQSSPGVSFSGVIATSNMTFNPRKR